MDTIESQESDMETQYLLDHDEPDTQINRVSYFLFGTAMQKCGAVLLKKGQTPNMKSKKKLAVKDIIDFILLQKGILISEQQIYKKLNSMKTRVKTKTDNNKTGNRKYVLNAGEPIFFELMGAEENPTVVKLNYGVSVSVPQTPGQEKIELCSSDDDQAKLEVSQSMFAWKTPSSRKRKNLYETYILRTVSTTEVDEEFLPSTSTHCSKSASKGISTVNSEMKSSEYKDEIDSREKRLSLSDLQRLVLMKQLEVFDVQKDFYDRCGGILTKAEYLIQIQIKFYEQELQKKD